MVFLNNHSYLEALFIIIYCIIYFYIDFRSAVHAGEYDTATVTLDDLD